jgi:hypothetical protein
MDVAFQAHVLRLAFPRFTIRPYLCVVDKSRPVTDPATLRHFRLRRDPLNPKARPIVTYSGNAAKLRQSRVMTERLVQQEVELALPEVIQRAETLADLITADGRVTRISEDVSENYRQCRSCEYRVQFNDRNGFRECWGKLADQEAHILDLHRVGQIVRPPTEDPVTKLIRSGRGSFLDLKMDDLGKADSSYRFRRVLQVQHTRKKTEFLPPALRDELEQHQVTPGYPLHFVDFEACNIALPHHAGLRPYERVAFQWSCHSMHANGELTHAEWLNDERDLPNFAFARTLRERLGKEGTVYVWSPYEQSTLNRVLIQLGEWLHRDETEALRLSGCRSRAEIDELAAWIDRLLGPEDKDGERPASPRIRDLHKLCGQHYFHPRMGGRTSIKVVLPAVWESNAALRAHPWFARYNQSGPNGAPLDPYKTLPPLPVGEHSNGGDVITDGTGAIRVYQDLIFDGTKSDVERENCRQLLRQYCQLDTAAMLMIWMHWTGRA